MASHSNEQRHKALIIDYIAGPAVGKSTLAALTFGEIKMHREVAEWSTEVAKELVWAEEFDILDNQHEVSKKQYLSFKSKADKVDFIVTDGSLILALYYNRANPNNVSNVEKTERDILKWHQEFDHLVIYLERESDVPYEQVGRMQNESEARIVDEELLKIMDNNGIKYHKLPAGKATVDKVVEMALNIKREQRQEQKRVSCQSQQVTFNDLLTQLPTELIWKLFAPLVLEQIDPNHEYSRESNEYIPNRIGRYTRAKIVTQTLLPLSRLHRKIRLALKRACKFHYTDFIMGWDFKRGSFN